VSDADMPPDRHVLLELTALLEELIRIRDSGDRARFDADQHYGWLLHRVWIAVGNEAHAYAQFAGRSLDTDSPWAGLYQLRNRLAHRRLPDIDEDEVWRLTQLRPELLLGHVATGCGNASVDAISQFKRAQHLQPDLSDCPRYPETHIDQRPS
jgi:uncharacterized protein with HEPN domain